jgi:hypothetical protein
MSDKDLERAMVAAEKLVQIFVVNKAPNAKAMVKNGRVVIAFDSGTFSFYESSEKRKGSWDIKSVERPRAKTTVFIPSTHPTIQWLMSQWAAEGKLDMEQQQRRQIVDECTKKLAGTNVGFTPETIYLNHVRPTYLDKTCTFQVTVPFDQAEEVVAKLAAIFTPS